MCAFQSDLAFTPAATSFGALILTIASAEDNTVAEVVVTRASFG